MKPKPPKNLTGKTIVTPQGKIRKGQRKPYHKATLEEVEDRIDYCLKLIIRGCTKAEIHRQMRDKFNVDWQVVDSIYIVRAEKLRRERAAMSTGEARDFVVTNLLDVAKIGKDSARISACAELSQIFGCYAPRKSEFSGPGGKPIQTEDVSSELKGLDKATLRSIVDRFRPEPTVLLPEAAPVGGNGGNGGNGNGGNGHY